MAKRLDALNCCALFARNRYSLVGLIGSTTECDDRLFLQAAGRLELNIEHVRRITLGKGSYATLVQLYGNDYSHQRLRRDWVEHQSKNCQIEWRVGDGVQYWLDSWGPFASSPPTGLTGYAIDGENGDKPGLFVQFWEVAARQCADLGEVEGYSLSPRVAGTHPFRIEFRVEWKSEGDESLLLQEFYDLAKKLNVKMTPQKQQWLGLNRWGT